MLSFMLESDCFIAAYSRIFLHIGHNGWVLAATASVARLLQHTSLCLHLYWSPGLKRLLVVYSLDYSLLLLPPADVSYKFLSLILHYYAVLLPQGDFSALWILVAYTQVKQHMTTNILKLLFPHLPFPFPDFHFILYFCNSGFSEQSPSPQNKNISTQMFIFNVSKH